MAKVIERYYSGNRIAHEADEHWDTEDSYWTIDFKHCHRKAFTEQQYLKRKVKNNHNAIYLINFDDRKQCYVREYRGSLSKDLKQKCNRKLRNGRRKGQELGNYGWYRRATEFWYDLY